MLVDDSRALRTEYCLSKTEIYILYSHFVFYFSVHVE